MKMKFKFPVGGALLLALAASPLQAQAPAPPGGADLQVVANESEEAFAKRFNELYEAGDWREMQRVGHERSLGHPNESYARYAEGMGAYMNGDVATSMQAYQQFTGISTSSSADKSLEILRAVQRNYPGVQFKPLEFVEDDSVRERASVREKTMALLEAKDYQGIEDYAAQLRKSNAGDALGRPFLQTLFGVISNPTDEPQARLKQLQDWQKAAPEAALPRLAQINYWTLMAYRVRGGGAASTITSAMSQKMDDALGHGTQAIAELPASAHDSPLLYTVLQDWARLSGAGRQFLDAVFEEGAAQFPDYLPIYLTRTTLLLPRWFGQLGEWEAMAQKRADQIGGAQGDMFYALIFIEAYQYVNTMKNEPVGETTIDMDRFWRGLAALRAKYPDSATLRTAQIYISDDQTELPGATGDLERAKSALSEPNGNVIDQSAFMFRTESFRQGFASRRMKILAAPQPK